MANKSTQARSDNAVLLALLAENLGHMNNLLGAYWCVQDSSDKRATACADILLEQLECYLKAVTHLVGERTEVNHGA